MAFDPDKYLAETTPSSSGFDPDKYLKETAPVDQSTPPENKGFMQKGIEGFNTFSAPMMESATLGASPYITAGMNYLGGKLGLTQDEPFSQKLASEKSFIQNAKTEHPWVAGAGEAIGTLAPALATGGGSLLAKAGLKLAEKPAQAILANTLAGAGQGALEAKPGEELKGAGLGAATSLGLSGLGSAVGAGAKKLGESAEDYAIRAVSPRIGDIKSSLKATGVTTGNRLEKVGETGKKLLDEVISPSSLGSSRNTFDKVANKVAEFGSQKGSIIAKHADEQIPVNDLLDNILNNKKIVKEETTGDPTKVQDFLKFLDERVGSRADENGMIPLSKLDEIQQGFKNLRTQTGMLSPANNLSEVARKEMVGAIKNTIGYKSPEDAQKFLNANKEYSFYKGLLGPAEETALRGKISSTQAGEMGGGAKGLALNARNVIGSMAGNARLAALLKYGSQFPEWIAKQMGITPQQAQLAIQNMAIQGENTP